MKTSVKSLALSLPAAIGLLTLVAAIDTAEAQRGRGRTALSDIGVGSSPQSRPRPIVRDHRDGYPAWGPRCKRGGCRR